MPFAITFYFSKKTASATGANLSMMVGLAAGFPNLLMIGSIQVVLHKAEVSARAACLCGGVTTFLYMPREESKNLGNNELRNMSSSLFCPHKNKIIHVDMDCFYAAIEIRDNPSLTNKPVAVGGSADMRGVICTSNYLARQQGVHSAMPTAQAYKLCKNLIVLPVDMQKYQQVAKNIHAIFYEFTHLVEPLALDEAYLDVTNSLQCHGSATLIAEAIRQRIWLKEKLTASAGVAPNKFLAKIASSWKKPNGLFVIQPDRVESFVKDLAVDELYGVGKVTAKKMHELGLKTCFDLQKRSLAELTRRFGKLGNYLYEQCRGRDHRAVEVSRTRKSLSVEKTFPQDIHNIEDCLNIVNDLFEKLTMRIQESAPKLYVKNQYIKIKFNDFKLTTSEISNNKIDLANYLSLLRESFIRVNRPMRLLGLGVHFCDEKQAESLLQQNLF